MLNVISFVYLWVNIFCLLLLVGRSSRVPPKRKKGTEENETAQPAGTVQCMKCSKRFLVCETLSNSEDTDFL